MRWTRAIYALMHILIDIPTAGFFIYMLWKFIKKVYE